MGRLLAAILLPAGLMLAAGPGSIEKTFDTTREPRISLNNLKGRVLVRGWDKAEVHLIYTVSSPRVEVDSEFLPNTGAADMIRLETHLLDSTLPAEDQVADYTMDVPVWGQPGNSQPSRKNFGPGNTGGRHRAIGGRRHLHSRLLGPPDGTIRGRRY